MEFGKSSDRHYAATVFKNNINLSTNVISLTFATGSSSFVYLTGYDPPAFRVFFFLATGYTRIPTGLETETVYYMQSEPGYGAVKLYLTKTDLDNNNPFNFTTENTADFDRCFVSTVDYKYTTFPCVEKAATDVEDMFCCPPAPDPQYRPEYITLNTGSANDSGDYYMSEYLNYSYGNIIYGPQTYASRNQTYVPTTRVQANIYDGPILYGTYEDTYTLRWEITTELADPYAGHPAGHKRNYVKLFINAHFQSNPAYYPYPFYRLRNSQSINLVEIYASPWVLTADFSYSATCTLIGNNDTDYMEPSIPDSYGSPAYYSTPAGLPIPHTVTLTPSANHTVFPASVRLVLKDAKFLTLNSEPNIPLGDIDVALTFNEALGGFYSEVLTLYGIQGRLSLFGVAHLTKTRWEDYTLRGTGFPNHNYAAGFYCNDIETNRGPLNGSILPGMIISTVSLVAGIGHGNVFYDSRWKINRVAGPAPYYPTLFTYFSWDEKNQSMLVTFSQYSSARKRPYGPGTDFFHTTFFSVYSGHPDSYYSSLVTLPTQPGTPPPPS